MTYLIRVLLPNLPGSLGKLAEAIGKAGGNIHSVDIVQDFPDGTVMDDMVIELPAGAMPDTLITAAHGVDGVEVDSIRPYSGRVDRRGQIKMLASVVGTSTQSETLANMIDALPQVLTSTWAILLHTDSEFTRVAASPAAPKDDGSAPTGVTVDRARLLQPDSETWVPDSWGVLDSSVAAAPLVGTDLILVIGRVGGPDYLASEVEHIGHLSAILGRIIRTA
ncbi:putative NAD-dependent malic enzyme [Corynebacterium kutscheri]|uniref:ACT domain-containing protein n=1 Tax=Corynebacterium kutscheri TaxID=35755 RepID=A0A0F6QZ86_9CORY|nr:amino acid-binding ACT domain protein [Corynebacterium kutscheri]AKE41002.1 ACT domain-containing protein [Corynebacterium kutscheri]VEH06890.1 putative NAD-dependent malic enzyme [Corynebacterium kutscheri]VEH09300.1 putative NAD-dependent malic enzyme [Corynebacterium kutscheri]VEH79388.1 putative NAD-dependent malic enzyme [Corynebacterium kutscheri]